MSITRKMVQNVSRGDNGSVADKLSALLSPYETVHLAGLGKGSGKTTVLRRLIESNYTGNNKKHLAVTSIGQGGDEVPVFPGMFAAAAIKLLSDCDFTKKICHLTGMNTSLGEVAVVEALSGGTVRLAGPSINSQLDELCQYLKDDCGSDQIIIDGFADKKTFISTGGNSAVVLCAGASQTQVMAELLLDIAYGSNIISLPEYDPESDYIDIQGALTEHSLNAALEPYVENTPGMNVVISDAGKSFLSRQAYEKYSSRGIRFYVKKPCVLAALALNPGPYDPKSFTQSVRNAVNVPVFDLVNNYEAI